MKGEKVQRMKEKQLEQTLDVLLDANFRELGSETVNRIGIDVLNGCDAVVISIGTFMAMGGDNHKVWYDSNHLSGYIGNAPLAFYDLVSPLWPFYTWRRASQHMAVAAGVLKRSPVMAQLRQSVRNVQIYSVLNVVTTVFGGAAGMITATIWWGYAILAPVILSSMVCNAWLRSRVAYDRPLVGNTLGVSEASVIRDLEFAASVHEEIKAGPLALEKLVSDPTSPSSVLEFLVANHLFEDLCLCLLEDPCLSAAILDTQSTELKSGVRDLLTVHRSVWRSRDRSIFNITNGILQRFWKVIFVRPAQRGYRSSTREVC